MHALELDFKGLYPELRPGMKIWDPVRKKEVKADPEEMVRQFLLLYLMKRRGIPRSLLSVEKQITVGALKKRYDIVVYQRQGRAVMLIECKAPEIKITQSVFDQVGRYNLTLKVPYLLVSNGHRSYCAKVDIESGNVDFLEDIPDFNVLSTS